MVDQKSQRSLLQCSVPYSRIQIIRHINGDSGLVTHPF